MFRHKIFKIVRDYKQSRAGHFGLWTAAAAFPILLITGHVVDNNIATTERAHIKGAVDVAVIAAASNNAIQSETKQAFATKVFEENYNGNVDIDLDVTVSKGQVEILASGIVPTSFGSIIGRPNIDVTQHSKAVMDQLHTICVLALAPDGKDRVAFSDNTIFAAPSCSVQANSADPNAVLSDAQQAPSARSFCSGGGAKGDFHPFVRGECQPAEDPYSNHSAPQPGMCVPDTVFFNNRNAGPNMRGRAPEENLTRNGILQFNGRHNRIKNRYTLNQLDTPISANRVAPSQVLYPGTYCGGLTIDTKDVVFMPGNYTILDGGLTFRNGAEAVADGVAFILKGSGSVVTIESGAKLYLKAPGHGPMAGFAFFQDISSESTLYPDSYPNGVNLIASGGELDVVGTLYFPTQSLDISGTSVIGARAEATAFIAYEVAFGGSAQSHVQVDHVAAGLPPMLPLSDSGARLVKAN